MGHRSVFGFLALSFCLLLSGGPPALATGLDPAYPGEAIGPEKAAGVIVWSHGRSINSEDSQSPTPPYLAALHDAGWEVMRFNRLRAEDTLPESTRRLVDHAAALKGQGYKRVVLAGQSFGAFLSLMAADASNDVDSVVATAPAAYGSFDEFYDSWRLNATRLYPLLEKVSRARVMLFYFHGDDFDPGGRSERSRAILSQRGLGYAVIDQPAYLVGHWASSTGVFLRRFGDCIRDFVEADKLSGEFGCKPSWGQIPSADLQLPKELLDLRRESQPASAETATGSAAPNSGGGNPPQHILDTWYGFYPNGREILLAVDNVAGEDLSAIYAIGPSIDNAHPAAWVRRTGHIRDEVFVFDESGKSTLRFRPRPDGSLSASWTSADGKSTMAARLRRIDPLELPGSRSDGQVQPQ
ncbi:MAG: alpha/beta hydrolase [Alphaproteobacteria bacterium]|nr:alpha/beta hydrolase [Alphaproteobacteria bacterium]